MAGRKANWSKRFSGGVIERTRFPKGISVPGKLDGWPGWGWKKKGERRAVQEGLKGGQARSLRSRQERGVKPSMPKFSFEKDETP